VKAGTLAFFPKGDETRRHLFLALTDALVVQIDHLVEKGLPKSLANGCRNQLAQLRGFDPEKVMSQTAPRAKFSDMDEDSIGKFVKIMDKLGNDWQRAADSARPLPQ